jgi:RNase P/RNase MRP subunit POP5
MMREKHRYILVQSTAEIDMQSRHTFEHELFKELLHNIGEVSYYRANPKIMKYLDNRKFILKCNLVKYKETLLALTFIKSINKKEMGFYTLNASGTIKALTK